MILSVTGSDAHVDNSWKYKIVLSKKIRFSTACAALSSLELARIVSYPMETDLTDHWSDIDN